MAKDYQLPTKATKTIRHGGTVAAHARPLCGHRPAGVFVSFV
jgi:hypothetical protein